jgi:O-antigen/teichoic acid export membrane protein
LNIFLINSLVDILRKFKNDVFLKNTFIVLMGSLFSQLMPILLLPFLTHYVSKETISLYFVWLGATNIFIVIVSGRLDMAIYGANYKKDVFSLIQLLILFATTVSIFLLLTFGFIIPFFNLETSSLIISKYYISLSLVSFFMVLIQGVMSYYNYHGKYFILSWIRIGQSTIVNLSILIVVLFFGTFNSMLYAHIISLFLYFLFIVYISWGKIKIVFLRFNLPYLISCFKSNFRFPLFSMPADFINTFATQMPLFLILSKYGNASVAFYGLTLRVLSSPIGLLSSSLLTVFKEQAGRDFRMLGNCKVIFLKTFRRLVLLGLLPFIVLFYLAPSLFEFVFGLEWRIAGDYSRILMPLYFLKFVISPLSLTLYLANRQLSDLAWQICLMVITFAAFYYSNDLINSLIFYSIGYSLLYLIYLYMSYHSALNSKI